MLRQEVLATLAYYDALDMPLSAEEVFRYLVRTPPTDIPVFLKMSKCLEELVHEGVIGEREGKYFLFDREYLVPLRRERERLALLKWSRLRKIARYLRAVPYMRLLFVSGSLSIQNTDEQSDLDVVIVTRHGRIWLTRLLVVGVLTLLRARRTRHDHAAPDKICPNHFITDTSLHIPFQSLYTAQLYANLVPVLGTDGELLKKFQMANEWLFHYLYHWNMPEDRIREQGLALLLARVGEFLLDNGIGDWLETRARTYQKRRITFRPSPLTPGGHLTFTDEALAFHAQSSASEILAHYENSQSKLTF